MNFKQGYAAMALLAGVAAPAAAEDLNALIWCDHADPALLEPFEKAHDVRVNVKEYEGTAAGLTLLEQSQPGDWDVMVIDAVDVGRAVESGFLAPLPADQLPTGDFFPEVVLDSHTTIDGKTYAVTEKFGYNTIAFNKANPEELKWFDQSLFELFDAEKISYEDALRNADSVNDLRLRIKLDSKRARNADIGSDTGHLAIV